MEAVRNSSEGETERGMRLLRARGLAELRQVTSDSGRQDLHLGNRKVASQVIGKDQCQVPGRGIVGKVRG